MHETMSADECKQFIIINKSNPVSAINLSQWRKIMGKLNYGLNRIMAPGHDLETFFRITSEMGLKYLEVRNDLPGNKIYDGYSAEKVNELSEKYGVTIITVNAVQQFNRKGNLDEKLDEVEKMVEDAAKVGCRGIILCPLNDPEDKRSDDESLDDTVKALNKYGRVFRDNNVTGLVEPLGFSICSIRTKKKAVNAINASDFSESYKIVHDTFHHYLAGEGEIFPAETGLVHISGVEDNLPKEDITDDNRILIREKDIMGNLKQIKDMFDGGYKGVFSFEPFGPAVQKLSIAELEEGLKESISLIEAAV